MVGWVIKMLNSNQQNTASNSGKNSGVIANKINQLTLIQQPEKRSCDSLIVKIIEKLAESNNLSDDQLFYKLTPDQLEGYDIKEKIQYNNVIKYKDIIDEYSQYRNICDEAFNIVDNNNIGLKNKLLRNINLLYKECKGEIRKCYTNTKLNEVDIIRENSDNIIDNVKSKLEQKILSNSNEKDLFVEDIDIGLAKIICYAFVECKILEKPR